MRDIKFRGYGAGWHVGNLIVNEGDPFIAGNLVDVDSEYIVHEFWVGVRPESVGQFTGLKDIEQFDEPKELFTGDIVKMHQFLFDGGEYENEIIGVLSYDEEVAAVCLTKINHHDIQRYMGYGTNEKEFEQEKIPVCVFYGLHECSWTYIGNIYENPELLEESK